MTKRGLLVQNGAWTIEYLVRGKWQVDSHYRTKELLDEMLARCQRQPHGKETFRGKP